MHAWTARTLAPNAVRFLDWANRPVYLPDLDAMSRGLLQREADSLGDLAPSRQAVHVRRLVIPARRMEECMEHNRWRHAKFWLRMAAAGVPLLVLLHLSTPALACHQQPPWMDAVDGEEIRYQDQTQWDDGRNWAINKWNWLNPITTLPDTVFTVCDLIWKDFSDSATTDLGRYQCNPGTAMADYVSMNTYRLTRQGVSVRRHVAMHELGHALGIDDMYEYERYYCVMYAYVDPSTCATELQPHDQVDYHERWGY